LTSTSRRIQIGQEEEEEAEKRGFGREITTEAPTEKGRGQN
jgi:hypothetical protein